MKHQTVRKIISFISSLSLVMQSFLPLAIAMPVYAEGDATDSAIVEVTPTPEVTPEPTVEPTPEVTPEITPIITPTEEPTPEITPDVLPSPEVTTAPVETITPEITPEVTPEVLSTSTEIQNNSPPAETPNQPTVTTDKADYAPTETVQIAGMFFLANTPYTSTVTSETDNYSNAKEVVTDEMGSFMYFLPLLGEYRPNYAIAVTDSSNAIVASTTFTDGRPSEDSCGNGIIDTGEECDGTNLGAYSSTEFSCTSKCEIELKEKSITICHASDSQSNPYNVQKPNKSADVSGHDDHNGIIWYSGIADHSWGDIIPPFSYIGGSYGGQNWPEGQDILNNDCEMPLSCEETKFYEKSDDFSNLAINIDFLDDDRQITVSVNSGYEIKNIWLDVDHIGFYSYATGPISNFNPPGNKIYHVKVEVKRVCASPVACVYHYTECSTTCGTGTQTLVIDTPASNGGTACPTETSLSCNNYSTCAAEEFCPTTCGYAGSSDTVPDGQGGYKTCPATNACQTGKISGTKYNDLDGDGVRTYHWENGVPVYDDPGLSGWEIYLDTNKDGDWDSGEPKTTTDAQGNYSFTIPMDGGTYRVREIGQTGWTQISNNPQDITVPTSASNYEMANINFGNQENKVTICHATDSQKNPYNQQTPDKSADVSGHDGHNGDVWYLGIADHSWGDIIPPFSYDGGTYAGQNWTTEGQVIWNNQCEIAPYCGDEKVNQESEQCDDGNRTDGDGCSASCQTEVSPVCGDGVKNGSEQCDGTSGITLGSNFCSTTCNLIPIYNGGNSCGENMVRGERIYSNPINSNDSDGELLSLTSGKKYLFEASNTFSPTSAPGYLSDAAFTWVNSVLSTAYGINGTAPDLGAHALLGNLGLGVGIIKWNNISGNNYAFAYTPTNSSQQFVIGDRWDDWFDTPYQNQAGVSDNTGSLNLDVYECVDKTPVCNDESAINYERVTDDTYADNKLCEYEQQTPALTISKSNDASGSKNPGGSVTYTIVVKAQGGTAHNVKMIDLLPAGFKYRVGSYTSSKLGVGEPTYASPGTWDLGTLNEGDEVTLTLIADISSDQNPGTYKDLALAYGCKSDEVCNNVIASAVDPGIVDDEFVGTEVEVIKDQTNGGTYEVEKTEGQVLGASTSLPATGASPIWLMLSFVCLVYGVRLIKSSNKSK